MRTTYDSNLKATITVDDDGEIRGIKHVDEYPESEHRSGREAAAAYVSEIAEKLNISREELRSLNERVSYLDPQPRQVEYRLSEEKTQFDTTTFAYYQTYLNTPVWEAGLTTTIKHAPTRIVAATNTTSRGIDAELPARDSIERFRNLFETGEKVERKRRQFSQDADAGSAQLTDILGEEAINFNREPAAPRLIRGRFFVYRYDPQQRVAKPKLEPNDPAGVTGSDDEPFCGTPPSLPLPPVPDSIREGHWYLVAELIFRFPFQGERMNWRALVEVETNTILYLRGLSSGITGRVFVYDPITSTGIATNTPDQSNAVLNPHRNTVTLPNLDPPDAGTQSLEGSIIVLNEIELKTVAAPTKPSGDNFDTYDVRTDDFAAVNAYYQNDRFFQLVESLGFPRATYFDGTTFPLAVDHRGKGNDVNMGNTINAHCIGDADGIDHACYALAHLGDTTNPIGIATDWRVILHELGGHGTLEDHVASANFKFAHSAGDSFAMIFNDFASEWHNGAAIDRFVLAPFVPAVARRSDRTIADGWGWGGVNDTGIDVAAGNLGYQSEQILSTTMFRFYRSIGGDSVHLSRREFAARCTGYLLLRAIGGLTAMSNPTAASQFLTALTTADAGNWDSEGVYGGAYNKVLTWSFEKQNLNAGAPPAVDVYIDDGRAGEYEFLPVHWATATIWNRREDEGSTPGAGHQEPALEATNFAYVKIKNRGTSIANNVIVRGYHCKPSVGVVWPNDFDPFTTAEISAGTLQPNNTEEKIVGPFHWTPVENAWGHDCMLMVVSATGDPSNVDNFTAGEFAEDWRLVPNDNNVAQRNVVLAPAGSFEGFAAALQDKGFWLGNPGLATANVKVSIALPRFLESRGWRINVRGLPEEGIRLKPREQKLVTFDVRTGTPFSRTDLEPEHERDIVVTATADGAVIGGMTYRVDPEIEKPYNDGRSGGRRDSFRACLKKINWFRLLLGAFVAALICFLTDGWFHESLVGADWTTVYNRLGVPEPQHNTAGLLHFAIFEVGRGLLALLLYAFMRCCCKPGWQTAALAGVVTWLAFSVTGPAQFIPLGFYSHELWVKVAAFQLVTSIIATIAGAAIYKERS